MPSSSFARTRAQRSAFSTASSVKSASETASALPVCSSSTRATESTMSVKRIAPAWNAATASSLAALNTAGWVPPTLPASLIMRTAGNASSSSGSKVQDVAFDQSHAGTAPGMRCGQVRPSAMGRTMLGGDACAMVEPSTNCTMECTMDCG